jgi:probable H4MPT-linked C1 transfer pathway protein
MMISIMGWDIGAANVKAALWERRENQTEQVRVISKPIEIWREKDRLPDVLRSAYDFVASGAPPQAMAVTMTAELSDAFSAKREGVRFILDSLTASFSDLPMYVFSLDGGFASVETARTRPLEFAASNWLASAKWIAKRIPNCLLIDVGSTTTDILPIVNGQVRVTGRTDLERLASGELVYTGVLRTNVAAIVSSVPVAGRFCRVASEYFAVSGDVHLILGTLSPAQYACATPDGRPASVETARGRLARLVCADAETLSAVEIDEMARYVWMQQVRQICEGIGQVISRFPSLRVQPVIIIGSGSFLGAAAAGNMGLTIAKSSGELGQEQLAVAPCIAAAQLLAEHLKEKVL